MIHSKRWTAAICLSLMTFLGGDRLSAADPVKKELADVKAKMMAEDWKEISKGVFERQLGPNKVEHMGFGREGILWTIGEMGRKLEFLRQEQESYPSEKLAKIIEDLDLNIIKAKHELWNLELESSKGLSNITANVTGGSCSNICYSATADAYPFTSGQGVAAVAEAKFNSTCGYSGTTSAYAYARATLSGTTTTVTQSDPDSGTNITSYAFASVSGGNGPLPCYSEASSSAVSSALGISYSTSDTNSSCPIPPCSVTISGTSYEFFTNYSCRSRTWTANVSGCTPSTYQWKYNGSVVGSGSTYTQSVCGYNGSFTLDVTVNGSATDSHFVTVDFCECGPCNGQICN
ncbi:MAG TPA: hypothetical protein VNW71_24255 [Thermoanaerobaculia bacterium]|nr:hypothetical protein [Thermoanaerobaculia bacterium]